MNQNTSQPSPTPTAASASAAAPLVYVGTYTTHASPAGGQSRGIYVFRMDPHDGALAPVDVVDGGPNPSFLAFHPSGAFLYAVNEVNQFNGEPGGGVSAFAVEAGSGRLTLLNQQSAHGEISCHISIDAAGRFALVANYSGGTVAVLPIDADGRLRPASDVVDHRIFGSAADPDKAPRAHSITLDAAQRFALAADLGLDKVIVYAFDGARGKLAAHSPAWVQTAEGAGPRHLDFHPNGRYLYLINELNATISAFAYDAQAGRLDELQTVSALPAGYAGVKSCADIHVTPDGKFLYGSNRGHNSLVIFAIDVDSGRLALVGHEPTQGQTPRNFAIDPSGTLLLAANQESDTIVAFRIDPRTGTLQPTGRVTPVPAPACVKFGPAP